MIASVHTSAVYTWQLVLAVIGTLLLVWAAAGTARGRSFIKGLFKGQSLEQLTSTWSDQIAATQAAYQVSESERHRLEEKLQAQDEMISDLRKQITDLRSIVTAREEVMKLTRDEESRHEAVMGAFTALASELARVSGAIERIAK